MAPLYYLSNGLSYLVYGPLGGEGFATCISPETVTWLTLTITNIWAFPFLPCQPFPTNGPSWTIGTLAFFYLVFPLLLPRLQRLSSSTLRALVVLLFYFQLWPLSITDLNILSTFTATSHPLSRLPVFLMGVLAGLLCLRGSQALTSPPTTWWPLNLLHDLLPWRLSPKAAPGGDHERRWAHRVDSVSFLLALCCVWTASIIQSKSNSQIGPHLLKVGVWCTTPCLLWCRPASWWWCTHSWWWWWD